MRSPSRHTVGRLGCALALAVSMVWITRPATAFAQMPDTGSDVSYADAAAARDAAERDLQIAQRAVAEARSAARSAKAELEASALASSQSPELPSANQGDNGESGHDSQAVSGQALKSSAETVAKLAVAGAVATEIETLEQLIADLRANRTELLTRLTTAHPLIVNADLRLDEHEQQLASLKRSAVVVSEIVEAAPPAEPEIFDLPVKAAADNGKTSRRLESALDRWEQAQNTLEAAMHAESTAVQRLVASVSRTPADTAREVETKTAATSTTPATTEPRQTVRRRGSQPLVLAALIIALIIAAVGSVKLARSADESVFAGADDAAAALALPVVGVIPAPARALAYRTFFERYRTLTFLAQLAATVLVFAVVAYCVQNSALLW